MGLAIAQPPSLHTINESGEWQCKSTAPMQAVGLSHRMLHDLDALKSIPWSHELGPEQVAEHIDASHSSGIALQVSSTHWKSQRSEWQLMPPAQAPLASQTTVHDLPPTQLS